jgi:hypothetical protein
VGACAGPAAVRAAHARAQQPRPTGLAARRARTRALLHAPHHHTRSAVDGGRVRAL